MLGQSRHVRCTFIKPIDGILFTRVLVFTLPMATNISVDDLSMLCKKKRHCISPCTDPIPCVRFYLWNPVSLTLKKIYKSQTKIQLVMVSCFFFLIISVRPKILQTFNSCRKRIHDFIFGHHTHKFLNSFSSAFEREQLGTKKISEEKKTHKLIFIFDYNYFLFSVACCFASHT